MSKCEFCGKETRLNKITGKYMKFCCEGHRGQLWRNNKRAERKKQHRCITCGVKIKPVIVYHIRCERHNNLNNKYRIKSPQKQEKT